MSTGALENISQQKSGRAIALPAPPPPRSLLKEAITSGEIGEQNFSYTGFIFFAHECFCQILKK